MHIDTLEPAVCVKITCTASHKSFSSLFVHVFIPCISCLGEDKKSYADPFRQRDFLTDISPWLGKLPAGTFRKMAQEAGFFADLEQIEDLKRIEERRGPRAHNEELVNIVRSEEQAGYIKLVKVIKRWGKYPDKVNKMNQLLPRRARV